MSLPWCFWDPTKVQIWLSLLWPTGTSCQSVWKLTLIKNVLVLTKASILTKWMHFMFLAEYSVGLLEHAVFTRPFLSFCHSLVSNEQWNWNPNRLWLYLFYGYLFVGALWGRFSYGTPVSVSCASPLKETHVWQVYSIVTGKALPLNPNLINVVVWW